MADFTLAPDFVFVTTPQYKTLVSEYENGVEQRRAKWATGLLRWKLQYNNRSSDDYNTVKAIFDSKKGAYSSFSWTNPVDNEDYTVRFAEDSLELNNISYGIYSFSFDLIQVK